MSKLVGYRRFTSKKNGKDYCVAEIETPFNGMSFSSFTATMATTLSLWHSLTGCWTDRCGLLLSMNRYTGKFQTMVGVAGSCAL